ncbi:DUF6069 family protein [Agromyces sp. H66]|uniref:DUF6069 family protein n=1 Tax=Agromyces sp. H66 TaxID=2529859 RepID=UPI001B7D8B0D|nr:DUF6069 family protein [Agromyces sp. H66]
MDITADPSMNAPDAAASPSAARRRLLIRSLTLVVAAAAGLAVWTVSVPLLGLGLTVGSAASAQTITPIAVVVAAVVAGAAAWALLALLERFRHGRRVWLVVGWVVLVLSLTGPLSMGAEGGTLASLAVMHVVVGAILIVGLTRARIDRPGK